jgi:hypothetical protein
MSFLAHLTLALAATTALCVPFTMMQPGHSQPGFPGKGGGAVATSTPAANDATSTLFSGVALNNWVTAGASVLNDSAYCLHFTCPAGMVGNGGVPAMMYAWSDAAYDQATRRLYVMGGGHSDLAANDVNAFYLSDLLWHRQSVPNPATIGGPYDVSSTCGGSAGDGINPDNTNLLFPAPVHTGGSLVIRGGEFIAITNGCRDRHTYRFQMASANPGSTGPWLQGDAPLTNLGFYEKAVLNTVDNKIYTHNCRQCGGTPNDTRIQVYDASRPRGSQWSAFNLGPGPNGPGALGYGYAYYENALFVPPSYIIGFGDASVVSGRNVRGQIVDLATGAFQYVTDENIVGDRHCVGLAAPGLAYNSIDHKVAVWCGGQTIDVLSFAFGMGANSPTKTNFGGTMRLTAMPGLTGATPQCTWDLGVSDRCRTSSSQMATGTWHRFFYDPNYGPHGLFGAVNSTQDRVALIETGPM